MVAIGITAAGQQSQAQSGTKVVRSPSSRAIALTFDDLPMAVVGNDHVAGALSDAQFVNAGLLRALQAHHATALGFVNEIKLNVKEERDARAQLLEDWLNAGMLLGNHGYSHREFNELSIEQYEEEFVRGEVITSSLLEARHLPERYFRAPYLDLGETPVKKEAFDRFLASHGYRQAPYTIQDQDWMFDASYVEARRKKDASGMTQVRLAYLVHLRDEFDHAEGLTSESFHRDIPQILFLHADMLNAENLDAVLALIEARGYRFIPLDEALRDAAYNLPDAFVGRAALSWLDRWQPALGRPIRPAEPRPPLWIRQDYKRLSTTTAGQLE